jgi:hypothetical protein
LDNLYLNAEKAEDCLVSPAHPIETGSETLLLKVSSVSSGAGAERLRVLCGKLLTLLLI